MIEKSTVLILGAGASAEYNFPVGYGLYTRICQGSCKTPPLSPRREHLHEQASSLFRDFRTELKKSGQLSVDAFLETRSDLVDIGKRAIACGLIPFENEEALFDPTNASDAGPRWYQLLLRELGNDINKFPGNHLSVLTFNYDRSLEHFLTVSLSKKYNIPGRVAWDTIQQTIPFHHLYGSLGAYTPDGRDGREYKHDVTVHDVQQCVESIRILREGTTQDEVFKSAHELLRNAELVVMLGFGFDHTNLERLKLDLVPQGKNIIASAFGMSQLECRKAEALAGRTISFGGRDQQNTIFLREHVTFE